MKWCALILGCYGFVVSPAQAGGARWPVQLRPAKIAKLHEVFDTDRSVEAVPLAEASENFCKPRGKLMPSSNILSVGA
jgi:hypothetical protein